MPAQLLHQPNPPPDPSLLPQDLAKLSVKLDLNVLSDEELQDVRAFRRAADYIAAGELGVTVAKTILTDWPASYDLP